MSTQRNDNGRQDARKPNGAAADEHVRSREGDPRKHGEQDDRTAGQRDRDRPRDDPSRAPESGTP